MVMPPMVIVLLVPMFLSANAAMALVVDRVTMSEPCFPTSAAEPFTRRDVALVPAL